jgi:hypothetical protein
MSPSSTVESARVLSVALVLSAASSLASAQCQVAKLTADDGAPDDWFGGSLSLSGDVVIVGAHHNDDGGHNFGAAYVFQRLGANWVFRMRLDPGEDGGFFGWSVAIEGDIAVIGAKTSWTSVFERSGDVWVKVGLLIPDDYEPGDGFREFGRSVAVSGSLAAVGRPCDNDNGADSGSVYVFERGRDGNWSQTGKLTADDGDSYDRFGDAVAVDGDVITIGAPDDEDQGNWSGSAYVFEREEDGRWAQAGKLLAHDGGPFTGFAYAVAVSGDTVLVGASDAHGNDWHCGAVYVFERDASADWPETAKLIADDGVIGDALGASVALDASVALVGAPGVSDQAEDAGAAYVFARREDANWIQVAKLFADDAEPDDSFGARVAIDDPVAVIGDPRDDQHGLDSGSAYVFAVGPDEDGDGVMDACECPGDLNHDWIVDYYDLAVLLADWDCDDPDNGCPGDCDRDGDTDHADLGLLLANWREICP